MATFVLIHGSYQGGWIWKRVAERLRKAGHEVYAPTLDGCAERAETVRPGITTESQADEVAQLLFYEDLNNVVLVGTSSGGMVACRVAELNPERIGRLVFVDALALLPGEKIGDIVTRSTAAGEPGGDAAVPRLRVRTQAGRWVVLHASWLHLAPGEPARIAVIIEAAAPAEVAAVIMQAYGLTERERAVTGLVCQGRSTAQITAELRISTNTVQDHLKSVFDKTGVRSRREVMAVILRDHYLPGLTQSRPVGPDGFFAGSG